MNAEQQTYSLKLHLLSGFCCLTILVLSLIGCRLTSLRLEHIGIKFLGVTVLAAMFAPIPVYWHQKKHALFRDTSLTIPWCMLLAILTPMPFLLGSHLHFPLRDALFARVDASLGINGAAIVDWTRHHFLGSLINRSYALLVWYLLAAIFVPALTGKKEAKLFLVANLVAIMIAVPCFTLFPAVGPWYSEHFAPFAEQAHVQAQVLELRVPHPVSFSHSTEPGL